MAGASFFLWRLSSVVGGSLFALLQASLATGGGRDALQNDRIELV
jgi:hypothetical protein